MYKFMFALILIITVLFAANAFDSLCSEENIKTLESCYNSKLFQKYNLPKVAEDFGAKLEIMWNGDNQTVCDGFNEFDACLDNSTITYCFNEADFIRLSFVSVNIKNAGIYVQTYHEIKSNCPKLFESQLEEAAQTSSSQKFIIQPNMIVFSFFVAIFSLILL